MTGTNIHRLLVANGDGALVLVMVGVMTMKMTLRQVKVLAHVDLTKTICE